MCEKPTYNVLYIFTENPLSHFAFEIYGNGEGHLDFQVNFIYTKGIYLCVVGTLSEPMLQHRFIFLSFFRDSLFLFLENSKKPYRFFL